MDTLRLARKVHDLLNTLDFDAQGFALNLWGASSDLMQNRLFDIFTALCYRWARLYEEGFTPEGHVMHLTCKKAKAFTDALNSA